MRDLKTVGSLAPDVALVTSLTRRVGWKLEGADAEGGVPVEFQGGGVKFLHPDVMVEVAA